MHKRTLFLVVGGTLAAGAIALAPRSDTPAQAQAPMPGSASADTLTELAVIEKVTKATDRALEYIASKQEPDGSWNHGNQAANALSLLAFMGRGHVPGRGPYKDVLERGKKFLLSKAHPDGNLGITPNFTMYEHGLCTLTMAEMYGMDADPEVEVKVRKAVDLICRAQAADGSWNYQANKTSGDLSITVMQIVALRAANNADIPVPAAVIEKAIEYVRRSASPAGGFGYKGPAQNPPTTAAGVLSLQLLGRYNDPSIPKSLDWLQQVKPEWKPDPRGAAFFYYYHYYAVQANYQAGGKYWNAWHPLIRELLLDKQNKEDGSWDMPPGSGEAEGTVGPNKVYYTAMGSLILDIYMHYLPAYQR